jgi:hypothetical protein
MPPLSEEPGHALEQYPAHLECLKCIRLDPRLWRRFGWSDVVNHTLLGRRGVELLPLRPHDAEHGVGLFECDAE